MWGNMWKTCENYVKSMDTGPGQSVANPDTEETMENPRKPWIRIKKPCKIQTEYHLKNYGENYDENYVKTR